MTNQSAIIFDDVPTLLRQDKSTFQAYQGTELTVGNEYILDVDWASVDSLAYAFTFCESLTTLILPDGFGKSVAQRIEYGFHNCRNLTTITGNPQFKVSVDLSACPLTTDSAMVIINGLQTVTTAQTLKLKSTTLAALTDEQKAVATAKGWTVA